MPPEIYDKDGIRRDEAWLRQKYGNVQFLDAGAGPKFRLARVDETEGPAVLKVRLLDRQGQPHSSQPVANHWPDSSLPYLGNSGLKTLWRDRAIYQNTDSAGFTGFGLGTGSYIGNLQEGGPHTVWVLSPSLASDGISGLGMLGGTNHAGPLFITFQIGEDTSPPTPPPAPPPTPPPTPPPAPPPEPGTVSNEALMTKLEQVHTDLKRLMAHLGADRA
jgi:hypothetical protein